MDDDPERIPAICKLLEEAWLKVPEQRFGQFLSNYVYGHHVDIFYKWDKHVLEMLEVILHKGKHAPKATRKRKK